MSRPDDAPGDELVTAAERVAAMQCLVDCRRSTLLANVAFFAVDIDDESTWQQVVESRRLLLQAKIRLRAAERSWHALRIGEEPPDPAPWGTKARTE